MELMTVTVKVTDSWMVKAVANAYWHGTDCECYAFARKALDNVPTADVAPVRHGHWIKISPAGIYECSECGKNVMTSDIEAYEYCHGCGAIMEGGTK